jgi:hypothetical protein
MKQQNQQVQWRRDKVQELCTKGYSQREISQTLQIGLATVNRDVSYLSNQAKTNIKRYIEERLPEEYEKCLVGLNAITKEACNTAQGAGCFIQWQWRTMQPCLVHSTTFIPAPQSKRASLKIINLFYNLLLD